MAYRLSPTEIVTITKEGECHVTITLDLNININANGQLEVANAKVDAKADAKDDDAEWIVPEFGIGPFKSNLLQFGKEVENETR